MQRLLILIVNRTAIFFIFACLTIATSPALATQILSEHHLAINLTAPIDMRFCIDGQPFSAVLAEGSDSDLPKDLLLTGHLRINTPDRRASKNQSIGFQFDSLSHKGRQIPIVCHLTLAGSTLIITRGKKKFSYPAIFFHAPVNTGFDPILCKMGWSREQIAKYENKLEAARTSDTITNRAALVWNKRYGMDAELYLAFPSTQFTPFKLETSDKLYVKIDSPVEISD